MVNRSLWGTGIRTIRSMVWACIVLMGSSSVWAGESTSLSTAVSHKVYTPKVLSADAAKAYLAQLGLGTVSQLPMTNGLLITGDPSSLKTIQTVLNVVDVDPLYEIRLAGSDSLLANLPSRDRIAAILGDIAVGTLDTLVDREGKAPVIIDRHQGQVLVIAPKEKMDRIMALVEGRVIIPSLDQDMVSKELDKSARTSVVEMASWTKSHVLGDPQTEPDAARAGGISQPVSAMPASGRITGAASSNPSNVNASLMATVADPNQNLRPARRSQTDDESNTLMYPTPEAPNADKTLDMNLPDKLPIEALLEYVGNYLHLDFMYDPAKVQGEVTLKLQGKLRGSIQIKDLYPLLESVLKFKGFVMTRRGNIVTVVPTMEAMEADPKLRTRSGPVDFGDAVLTRVFRLRYVDTASAETLLTQMKLGVAFSSIAETKTLIVTAFTATMPRIEALMDLVDQPGEPKQFRYRPLKYTLATTLTEKVKALAEQMGTIQVSVSGPAQPILRQNPGESDAAFRQRQAREMAMRAAAARAQPRASTQAEPETIYLDADERTNRILMVGRQEQLAVVDRLVDSLDVQQQDLRSLLLYRIEHVDAQDVRKKLEELDIIAAQYTYPTSSTRITGAQRTAATSGGQPTPQPMVQTPETAVGASAALDAPQVVVVEATNALLVNATAEQHKRIAEILKYVDSETLDSAMPFEIYPLENQGPDRMAEIIDKLVQERLKDKEGKIEQVVKKIEDEITIVADPNTYSLVVHASPKNQQWIGKLVKTLDKRRPQVLIDLTLVEVSKTEDFNYDLNLITAAPDLSRASGLVGETGVISGALKAGNVIQAASGNFTGFYGDDHINALLKTMQSKKYGRVLAKPKILVNDNEVGTIKTTDTTYVKTLGSTIPALSGNTTGSITTSQQFEGYDAGITLDITPHISEGDLLQLKVNLVRSDFTNSPTADSTGVTPPPNKSSSDITTVVTVPDKSTIILGGMIKLNQSKGGTKVPILGDLPLLGAAFRTTGNSDIEKKLYVFVKAEIIRPADVMAGNDTLQKLSDRHRMAFERHEAEFQQEQSIPGVKSKPMSPDKVLDAQ